MSYPDIRNFEGHSWSALAKCVEKENSSQKKVSFLSDTPQSNSISLNIEDIGIYGKYPCAEPFILALCLYCGDRFKVPALAHHLATKHQDGKTVEGEKSKGDAKSPSSILKKHKLKSKKESKESAEPSSHVSSTKVNKQPSKVLIQVDRRRVNCTTTGPEHLFVPLTLPDSHDDILPVELKTEKDITPKIESAKVKKIKDDRGYSSYKSSSSKLLINGASIDHSDNSLVPRSKESKSENKKLKTASVETESLEKETLKNHEENSFKPTVLTIENGISDDQSDDSNTDIKRRKVVTSSTRTYNPDRHCGVIGKENSKPCTRSLTCKSHTMSLRRAVRGRSKNFDQLLADHRAEKESSKQLNLNNVSRDVNMTSNIINNLQLTPIKIPLVLNPLLAKVDSVKDLMNSNHLPSKNLNGIKTACDINTDLMHNMNKLHHFQTNNQARKKVKKRKKKRKLNKIKKSQVKSFSQSHPWYRRVGGMLYVQNNLPTFASMKNVKKKIKKTFNDTKENQRFNNINTFRSLNFNNTGSIRNQLKSSDHELKDWAVDLRLQYTNLRNATSVQVYSLEDVKDVYFKLIPENKCSSVLRIKNDSLAITFPQSSLSLLTNSLNSDNQFLVQKKIEYPFIHKYIYSYNNSEESSSESDGDDLVILEDITDIRYSMMEPVKTTKEIIYKSHLTLNPLTGHPLRLHRFPSRADERNFSLGIGTLNDGQVSLETTKRLHFVTPSGPMAVSLKQHPVIPEGSYDLVKSLIEE